MANPLAAGVLDQLVDMGAGEAFEEGDQALGIRRAHSRPHHPTVLETLRARSRL